MKEYDRVVVTVEKEKYACDSVHKGMTGWICDDRIIDNCRLVCFDNCDLEDYPIVSVKIDDLEVIWEAPTKEISVDVVLSTNIYENAGLYKGLKGTVIDKGTKEKEWIVRFVKQERLQQDVIITVIENDISII